VPEGRHETFTVARSVARGPADLVMRTDEGSAVELRVEVIRGEVIAHSAVIAAPPHAWGARVDDGSKGATERWFELKSPLPDVGAGDRVRVFASRGAWRSFHYWLIRP
jgi:hypothetical protein